MGKTQTTTNNKAADTLKVNSKSKPIQKADKTIKKPVHKWNRDKLVIGDYFSCHQYMKVTDISFNNIKLVNERGEQVLIDRSVLINDSYSADHVEKEVNCTMTELSEILKGAKDTIFQVVFNKQVDDKLILEKLGNIKASDIKNATKLSQISKDLIQGTETTLTAHLVKSEQHMGRSLVIDLNAPESNRFRQVDHRTIKSIILRNVKYNIAKKSTLSTLEGWKYSETAKWDGNKLSIGNWFSENQFYKVTAQCGNAVDAKVCNEGAHTYSIPLTQLHDMHSASLFEQEEKITKTQMIELLLNAKESVFTCTFHKKITSEDITELL